MRGHFHERVRLARERRVRAAGLASMVQEMDRPPAGRAARADCDEGVSAQAVLLRVRGFAEGRIVKCFALMAALG